MLRHYFFPPVAAARGLLHSFTRTLAGLASGADPPYAASARADDETETRLAQMLKDVSRASHSGMKREALSLATRYREECLAAFGRAHFRYASALNTLGLVHKNRGEVALAVGAYSGALALLGQSDTGRSSLAWAAVAANTGACYRSMAEGARTPWERLQLLENSLAYTTQALAVRASSLPEGHESIGDTLSSLGGALRAASDPHIMGATATATGAGDALMAERVGRLAVTILEEAPGGNGRDSTMWATAVSNLSLLLLQPLPVTQAGEGQTETDDDSEDSDDEDDGIRVHAAEPQEGALDAAGKARAEAEQWRATEAEGLLRQALSVRRKRLGKTHPDTIETMLLLSRAVLAAGAGSASAEAESSSIRSTADSLFDQLRTMQQEDDHGQQRRV